MFPVRCSVTDTGTDAVVISPGYSARNGAGLLVDVSTPVKEPVQLKDTLNSDGVGVPKNTVRFPASRVVASVILNV